MQEPSAAKLAQNKLSENIRKLQVSQKASFLNIL